jgi:hypothetical protein
VGEGRLPPAETWVRCSGVGASAGASAGASHVDYVGASADASAGAGCGCQCGCQMQVPVRSTSVGARRGVPGAGMPPVQVPVQCHCGAVAERECVAAVRVPVQVPSVGASVECCQAGAEDVGGAGYGCTAVSAVKLRRGA